MKTITFIIISLFIFPFITIAQTGSIAGKVIDTETKEPIMFGNVVIEATGQGVSTDIDGNFLLENLKVGIYTIKFSYLGMKDKIVENIEVKENETTTINAGMGEDPVTLDLGATISAERIVNTEAAVLSIKKESTAVLDGVSSKEISKNGDSDAGAAVKRISGVTVESGKYVYVRGLGDRYGKTTLNGADIPGLDPNKNTVQMDLFPTNLLDNILVYKTFTPDLPGDFTGGYIDVITKNFPSGLVFSAAASMGYNTQTTFNKNFLTQKRGSLDWIGFDDGSRAMPASVVNSNIPAFQSNTNSNFDYGDAQKLVDMTRSFSNNWEQKQEAVPFNHSFSLSLGNQFKLNNQSAIGIIGALSYNRNYNFYENGTYGVYQLSGMYNTSNSLTSNLKLRDNQGSEDVLWGAMLNIAYKIKAAHTINFMAMHNQSGTTSTRYLEGEKDDERSELFQTRTSRYLERGLTTFQLGGKHTFLKVNNLEVNWKSSFARSTQKDPDLRYFTNRYDAELDVYKIKPSSDRTPSRFYRDMSQVNWFNKIDLTLPFNHWSADVKDKIKIKAGFVHTSKDRTFKENRYSFENQQPNFAGNIPAYFDNQNLINTSPSEQLYVNNGAGIYMVNALDSANIYDASQTLFGGYAMTEMPIIKGLNLVAGLRLEYTSVRLKTFSHKVLTTYPQLDGVQNLLSNLDLLPAITLNYEPTSKMKIRAAYSRTLARPSFRELAPFTSFDVEGGYAFVGNPSVQRTTIDNADLRWEFYPSAKELISVSAFYKDFTNPIERTFNPKALNPEITYRNVSKAFLAGVEVEVRKSLDFITPALKDLTIGANFSYIYSQTIIDAQELISIRSVNPEAKGTREMYGQSPYSINSLISYKNDSLGLSINLVFNVSGPKISFISIGGTPNTYVQPQPSLSFNISKTIIKGLDVKFSMNNILLSPYRESMEFKGTMYDVAYYQPGMDFSLGINYNFSKE